MSIARYECNYIPMANKVENLKKDGNYYRVVVGGFNIENHSGAYYPLTPSVEQLFSETGIIRRRINAGLCRGEYGHPKPDGMDMQSYIRRLAVIDPLLTSHHFRSFTLEHAKDEKNKDIILTVAELTPSGPYGPVLKQQLENLYENVAFSIRSFTNNAMVGSKQHRIVKDALTWDAVSEPGIKTANQYFTANLESVYDDIIIDEHMLNSAIDSVEVAGLESEFSTLSMVRTNLGWQKVQIIRPSALQW